jgi:very-short-patch-repair endonuclease
VDGGIHDDQKEYDRVRERHLARWRIDVRRVRNADVFSNSGIVAAELCRIIQDKTTPWYKKILNFLR